MRSGSAVAGVVHEMRQNSMKNLENIRSLVPRGSERGNAAPRFVVACVAAGLALWGCATTQTSPSPPRAELVPQPTDALVADEVVAIAYSGFREGQHPDRGSGAIYPSRDEILEDLKLLSAHGFRLIRVYGLGEDVTRTLELIRQHDLPIRVLLGAWLRAEVSSHETCAWVEAPVPQRELEANRAANVEEIRRAIEIANAYPQVVVAVSVGNEALVTWNDHLVSIEAMARYLEVVRAEVEQPVTTADNYLAWVEHADALAPRVDFALVHSYPVWEGRDIDEGLSYTVENLEMVRAALPDTPIAIGEAGWPDVAVEFGSRASEAKQARYVRELVELAYRLNLTTFLFEAFDEPWKGHSGNPNGAEKHWGLFTVDRQPKAVMKGPGLIDASTR